MAKQESRKSGGAKTSRSETVTVRLDPQVRYLAELAARSQRRTLSSFTEWAVEEGLKNTVVFPNREVGNKTVSDLRGQLWDPIESERFLKLATTLPSFLTHNEQLLWKLICDLPTQEENPDGEGYENGHSKAELELIRKHWLYLNEAAQAEELPSVVAKKIKEIDAKGGNHG